MPGIGVAADTGHCSEKVLKLVDFGGRCCIIRIRTRESGHKLYDK